RSTSAAMRVKIASLRSASVCSSRWRRATNSSIDSEKYETTSSTSRASAGWERPETASRWRSSWSISSGDLIPRSRQPPESEKRKKFARHRAEFAQFPAQCGASAAVSGHSRWALIGSREEVSEMKLYYSSQTRAVRPRWLLEEIGAPYEIVRLS